jgi:pyruvate dehydrogenase (quinone)
MKQQVGDHIVERLGTWGVRRFYGYPGDGIGGLLSAVQRAGAAVEFVLVRHEETAGPPSRSWRCWDPRR